MFKNKNSKEMDDLERFLLENTIISIEQNLDDGTFTIKGANGSKMQTKEAGSVSKIKHYFTKYAYDVETLADSMEDVKCYKLDVSENEETIKWYNFNVETKEVDSVKRKVGVIAISNNGKNGSQKLGHLFETEINRLKPWLLKCFSVEEEAYSLYSEGDEYKIVCGDFSVSSTSSLAISFLSSLKNEHNRLVREERKAAAMQKKIY